MEVMFYEAFEEEAAQLKCCMPAKIKAHFTWKTIQEYDSKAPCGTAYKYQNAVDHPSKLGKYTGRNSDAKHGIRSPREILCIFRCAGSLRIFAALL